MNNILIYFPLASIFPKSDNRNFYFLNYNINPFTIFKAQTLI